MRGPIAGSRGAGPRPGAKSAALGNAVKSVGKGIKSASFYTNEVNKGLGNAALGAAKGLAKMPIRVGSSLAEIPDIYAGKQPWKEFNVKGLGKVKTYARESEDIAEAGGGTKMARASGMLMAGSKAILDTAAIGGAAQTAKNAVLDPQGKTSALSKALKGTKIGSKIDQLTYRPYMGAPRGWQLRASQALNLPFWKMQ